MQVCFVGNFNFCSCLIQPGLPMAFRADDGILLAYYRVTYCQAFPTLIPSQYRNNGNINKMGSINNYDLGTLVLCIGRYNHIPLYWLLYYIYCITTVLADITILSYTVLPFFNTYCISVYHYCIGRYNQLTMSLYWLL